MSVMGVAVMLIVRSVHVMRVPVVIVVSSVLSAVRAVAVRRGIGRHLLVLMIRGGLAGIVLHSVTV
jgi:hypothetical protein